MTKTSISLIKYLIFLTQDFHVYNFVTREVFFSKMRIKNRTKIQR